MDINTPTSAFLKYPSKIFITIASLEDLAATSLALDLWHHNQLGHFSMPQAEYNAPNFKCGQILSVSLPQCITKNIDTRIRSVSLQVNSFYRIFVQNGIFPNICTFVKYFDSFTYGPDGAMCRERTAKNLLTKDDLTQWDKFQIACVYWLEDEIREIWPTVSDHPDPNESDSFEPFVRYWMVKMRNCSTDSVPYSSYYEFQKMSVAAKNLRNWTALANVLNEFTTDQQYDSFRTLATRAYSGFKNLLPKLNEIQVDHILSNFPDKIILRLALQNGGFEYAIKIWNIIRDTVSMKTFYNIIIFLMRLAYDADKFKRIKVTFAMRTQAQAVLLEMWTTLPNRLKMELLGKNKRVERLFKYLSDIEIRHSHCLHDDINFISRLFSDLPVKMRSSIWCKYWRHIVYFSPPKIFNRLLSLGLINKNYSKFVVKEIMNYTKNEFIISRWLKGRLFQEVINFTKLCSWNEQLVREFRKQVFLNCIPSSVYFSFNEFIKIGAVIDESLSNVEATEAKKCILFSLNGRGLFRSKLEEGLAIEAISMVDGFLSTERSLREKQLFLDHWYQFLNCVEPTDPPVVDHRWKEFLYWWVDKTDDLPIFKEFLPVAQIFEELLLKTVPMLEIRFGALGKEISEPVPSSIDKLEEFAEVDEFLMWYFGNDEAVNNFKRDKISNYQKIVELNDLLSSSNESIVNRVIAWFFNYNIIEVGQFKNVFDEKDLLD